MSDLSPEEIFKIRFGINYSKLVAADPSWKDTFPKNLEPRTVPQKPSAEQSSECVGEISASKYITPSESIKTPKIVEIKAWGDVLRSAFPWEKTLSVLDPILGCLKMNKHSIAIHQLEKDLLYLIAMSIEKRSQIFISFPISPVSLGSLTVVYFAHIANSFFSKAFIIWVRPKDNGQILRLRTTNAFNLVDKEDTHFDLRQKITCLPSYKISEPYYREQRRVFMVRSLSEAIEFLKQSNYCSLVVLDDPSGSTDPSPSILGKKAFELGAICQQKQIPMVGIVPPWSMKDIEYHENQKFLGIKLWPIDFFALCSYPKEPSLFSNHVAHHPIDESYLILQKKRATLKEAEVIIKTFSFETDDEETIAELFIETSDLLLDLAHQPNLRNVWATGWEIWRHLSAPVLPFHHLWGKFLESSFKRLQLASNKCKESKALILFNSLNSLAMRLYKLKSNPFLEIIKIENLATTVAVENAEIANALEQFLMGSNSNLSIFLVIQVYPLVKKQFSITG